MGLADITIFGNRINGDIFHIVLLDKVFCLTKHVAAFFCLAAAKLSDCFQQGHKLRQSQELSQGIRRMISLHSFFHKITAASVIKGT